MFRKFPVPALTVALLVGIGGLAGSGAAAAPAATQTAKVDGDQPRSGADKGAAAATRSASKPAQRPTKSTKGKPAPEPEPVVAEADTGQIEAVGRVFVGSSDCEFNQKISLEPSQKHNGYVDLQYGKKTWLMRPVISPTGAVRLEDVRSEALLIQIGSKTMVLNQKTGQRIVDECRHAKQITDTQVAGSMGIAPAAPAGAAPVGAAPAGAAPVGAAPAAVATTAGNSTAAAAVTTATLATPDTAAVVAAPAAAAAPADE